MKKQYWAAALAACAACATAPAVAGPDVGVSIGIHQPGVYGRIDIGSLPQPALVYPEPVIVAPARIAVERRPIYLYVPPLHQQNWRRYCGQYAACGQPVYFVQDRWVRDRWSHAHPGWHDSRPGRFERGHHGRPDAHHDRGRHNGHDDHRGRGHGGGHGRDR